MERAFRLVDVFASRPYEGNPVAVVLDGQGLSERAMQQFAHWTNLSEATFVLPPSDPSADYRVRIFEPAHELPFAGHPTLGTCHAWLEAGGRPRDDDRIVQECGAGLVAIHRTPAGLAFDAPGLVRYGPVEPATVDRIAGSLRIEREAIIDAHWVDNGPGWVAVLLADAAAVLAIRPGVVELDIGVVALHPPGGETAIEVRAFFANGSSTVEDPVTGSLNASLAQWLLDSGRLRPPYVASQGTALGRAGRVFVTTDERGTIRVAGATLTRATGVVDL